MKKIRFDCHGHNAPAYGCNEPGDNSGWYFRADDVENYLLEIDKMNQIFLKKLRLKNLKCVHCNTARAEGLWSLSDTEAEAIVPLCDDCADLDLTGVFFSPTERNINE